MGCHCHEKKCHCHKTKCVKRANIDTKCTLAVEFRDGTTPSDNNTAVGIDRLVCCVNDRWSILNKESKEVISRTDAIDFFSGTPTVDAFSSSITDPVVQWDEFEDRFIGIVWEQVDFRVTAQVEVETPEGIIGNYNGRTSTAYVGDYGPFVPGVDIVPADPLNADTALVNDLTGQIALIAADGFQTGSVNKCNNALNAGAIGIIMYSDTDPANGFIFGIPDIPAVYVTNSVGLTLLNNQPVTGGIMNLSEPVGYSKMHICVSKDSSPNDSSDFYFYEIGDVDGPYAKTVADYPKLGIDSDAIYISTNTVQLNTYSDGERFYQIVASEKSGLIDGTAVSPLPILVNDLTLVGDAFELPSILAIHVPTLVHTPQFNTNQVMFFVRSNVDVLGSNADGDALIVKTISNVLETPEIQEFNIAVEPWVSPAERDLKAIVQPAGVLQQQFPPFALQNSNATPIYRCVLYNDSLWLAMSVGPSGKAEVRWYELDVSQFFNLEGSSITLKQEGKIVPEGTTSAFWPSIDVDKDGNMGIGFNIAGPDQPVAIAHTGRLACDPAGTVRLPYQVNFVAQPDLPFFDFSINTSGSVWWSRWNDYTSCVLDPVDRKTFNFTCQYSNLSLEDYFAFDPQWKSGLVTFCVEAEKVKVKKHCCNKHNGEKSRAVIKTDNSKALTMKARGDMNVEQMAEMDKLSKMSMDEKKEYLKELGQKKANSEALRKGRKVKIGKFEPCH